MIPPIASDFVAGESRDDALARAEALESRGITALLNQLGEHYGTAPPALSDTKAYVELVRGIDERDLGACISVKPSQLGLEVSEELFVQNVTRIAEAAEECGVFVWMDMEDHTTTDATIEAYERLIEDHPGMIGICLQANLRRTPSDIARLGDTDGKLRLVKGAYDEPDPISHTGDAVDAAYKRCIEQALREHEVGVAVGTHDDEMIAHAEEVARECGRDFELQMLMGVREEYQDDLARSRETYQYVPYGDKWLSYFYRRVRERSENLEFAVRAVLDRYL